MKRHFHILLLGLIIVFNGYSQQQNHAKKMYMWFDCEANFKRLSYPDSIAYYFNRLKELGFTDIVADVKAITGETLFRSRYAPYMQEWDGFNRNDGYDMLAVIIREAHQRSLRVHASLNVFCGGHLYKSRGIIFNEYSDWQAQVYTGGEVLPISKAGGDYNGMLNPSLDEVRTYELNILKEVVSLYKDLDGVILDRVRFSGITSDFSQESKRLFEKYAKLQVRNFPQDIIYWAKDDQGNDSWKPGKYFNQWVEWRASLIYTFIRDVRKELKAINPAIQLSDYAGSWYPLYYQVGVNWASRRYDPSKEYDWATKRYKNYAYAELLDEFQSGLYYTEVTIDELRLRDEKSKEGRNEAAMGNGKQYWYSVEGAAKITKEVICGVVPVIGSLYVDQYNQNADQFKKAVSMTLSASDGLMIFDIVHIINKDWWDVLKQGIDMSDINK